MITINIGKKELIVFLGVLGVFVLVGIAMAYNSGGPPSVVGHSFEELEGVQKKIVGTCPEGQVMVGVKEDGSVNCKPSKWKLNCYHAKGSCAGGFIMAGGFSTGYISCCKVEPV